MMKLLLKIFCLLLLSMPMVSIAQQAPSVAAPCYSGGKLQTKAYSRYDGTIINTLLTNSTNTKLTLYDRVIKVILTWGTASVNFDAPSYWPTTTNNKVMEIYYTNNSGPTIELHRYPVAKVYDWYSRPQSNYRMDQHYLQFTYKINNGTNVPSATLFPRNGGNYTIQQYHQIFRLHSSRESSSGFCADWLPNNQNWVTATEYGPTSLLNDFEVRSIEADFKNMDAGTQLKFCKENRQIDLYNYFTDQNNVKFELLDGNTIISTGNIINLQNLNSGTYKLRASKSYANGNFSKTIDLVIINTPVSLISSSLPSGITSFCEGETVTLSAPEPPAGENYTYKWSGNSQTSRSIVVTGNWSGTVTVNNGFCETISPSYSVTVNSAPKPYVQNQSGNNTLCEGSTATLVTNAVGIAYSWENENGESVGTQQVISVTKAGTYKVTVFYANGCQSISDPITIVVNPNPVPTITVTGNTEFCEGDFVTLTAQLPQGQVASAYRWSNGENGQTIIARVGGVYTVTATNSNGCTRISEPVVLKTLPNPKPLIAANGPLNFCDGGSVKLTVTNAEGASEILWSDGSTEPSITVTTSGIYYVSVKRNTCFNTSEQVPIEVYANVTPTIQALGETNLCEGDKVTLQVTNPQPNTQYEWSNGARGLEIEVEATGQYYVIAKNQFCTSNSLAIPVKVSPIQVPLIMSSGVTSFCEGSTVTLTVTNATDQDDILWSNGARGRSIVVDASGRYYATLTKGTCQRTSQYTEVTVYANTKPFIEAMGGETICEGESVILQITNPQPNVTYTWSNGTTGLQTTVHTKGAYFVTSQNRNDCSRTSDRITINVIPIAKPTISLDNETTICQGDSIVLTINESAASYRWNSGENTKKVTIKNSGTYIAYLSNADCERASDPLKITVNPNNKIVISQMGELTFCEGESLQLTVLNTGKYLWNTGETTRTINITKSGKYSVTVENTFGCISTSEVFNVTVRPLPKPTINVTGLTTFCEGDSVLLTINESARSYRWNNGATTKSTYVKVGGRYVAYISNDFGCERASDAVTVQVHPNPTPVINILGKTEFCETDSVLLYVTPIAGMTYTWSDGVKGSSTVVKKSGNYYVTSTTANNCTAISETIDIKVHPLPKPTVHISGNTTLCEGDSVVLTINEAAASYRWSSGETTRSITVKIGATYTAFITNPFGCERASTPIVVNVNPNPKPTISYTKLVACDGDSVKLNSSIGVSYLWSDGQTTRDIWVKDPALYYVVVTNAFGCANTSAAVRVNILQNDVPTITSSNGQEFCEGGTTTLTASEGSLYRWSTGETTRSIVAEFSGVYTVTVINANDCGRSSLPIKITVHKPTQLRTISDINLCENDGIFDLDKHNSNNLYGRYSGTAINNNKFNPKVAGIGNHEIVFVYTNAFGCISKEKFNINISALEVINHLSDTVVCVNSTIIPLMVNDMSAKTFITGTGLTGTLFNPTTAGVGRHLIMYTLTNANGCLTTSTQVIEVVPAPTAPTVLGNVEVCMGSIITLTASSTVLGNHEIIYKWYKQGESNSFATGKQIRYTVLKNEVLLVTASTEASCASIATEINIISTTPNGYISANKSEIIQGDVIDFSFHNEPASENAVRFEWSFGDNNKSFEQNPSHYFNKPGEYKVEVVFYSKSGCRNIVDFKYVIVTKDPVNDDNTINPIEPEVDERPFTNNIVYPNPIKNNTATLRYDNQGQAFKGKIQVYGITGALVLTQDALVESGINEIPIKNIERLVSQTIFLVVLTTDDGKKIGVYKVLKL